MFTKNNDIKLRMVLKNILSIAAMFLLLLSFTSCEKESSSPEEALSEEEVVAVVEGALIMETEGITAEALDAAEVSVEYSENGTFAFCETPFDTMVVRSYSGTRISSAYTSHWGWTVHCNNLQIPNALDFNRTTVGLYETLRMSSDDNATSEWSVDNLITGEYFIINGSYTRTGNQTSKIRSQNTFSSTLSVTVSNLNIDKDLQRLESGTATFSLSGQGTGGTSFLYEGDITFLGDGMATVTINGMSYDIDLFE